MAAIWLENEAMRVGVSPAYGARVTNIIDKATGRDWIAPGTESPNIAEDAVYLAAEAVGWDECFPTVAPWDASGTAWGRMLRDHGDIWGRPWTVAGVSGSSIETVYATDEFRFSRRLALHGTVLTAAYEVNNYGVRPLPWMWALHALLAVNPDDRIMLPGIDSVAMSYFGHDGATLPAGTLPWPGPAGAVSLPLDVVHPASANFAAKLYASNLPQAAAAVGHAGSWLTLGWRNDEIAHLGIWLTYGGWPAPGGAHAIALEPTTGPTDHLGQGLADGSAEVLAPGAGKRWSVTLRLSHAALPPIDPT